MTRERCEISLTEEEFNKFYLSVLEFGKSSPYEAHEFTVLLGLVVDDLRDKLGINNIQQEEGIMQ